MAKNIMSRLVSPSLTGFSAESILSLELPRGLRQVHKDIWFRRLRLLAPGQQPVLRGNSQIAS